MRRESRLLANALLVHHRMTTAAKPPGPKVIESHYTIPYGRLCDQAGMRALLGNVSVYLLEIAEWCAASQYPALNSLAVNAQTGMPGEGYDGAGGFEMKDWHDELLRCVRFPGYPQSVP